MSPVNNAGAFFRQHRNAVLAAGGVVGLALFSRSRKKAAAAAAGTTAGTPATTSQVGAAADPYATVANDVYDALQPQLEQSTSNLQTEIDAIRAAQASTAKAAAAAKKHPKKPAPAPHKRKAPRKAPKKPILKRTRNRIPPKHPIGKL